MADRVGRLAGLMAALLLAACATTVERADRAWRKGDLAAAASEYEKVLTEGGSEAVQQRAMLRLAVALVAPRSPVPDPARARSLLGELLARQPVGEAHAEAETLLALLDRADAIAAELDRAERERARLAAELDRLRVDASVKDTTVVRLRTNLAEAEAEIDRLRRSLEQLKRIDLDRKP